MGPVAFTFGSPWMLWWLAAAAAPLLLHLWNRRKYRETDWAAMEYLLAAWKSTSRRIRLEQWILLAVRTLLIVLVVLAFAQPRIDQGALAFVAGERSHKVLVVDGSFSMDYRPTDVSRFDRAKLLAQQIVDEAHQGDGFTLIVMAAPPQVVIGSPAFERSDVTEEIEGLPLTHAGVDLPATLERIKQALERARREHPRLTREEVYFLTDLQRAGWVPELSGPAAVAAFRQLSRELSQAAHLVVVDVGQAASENLAVTRVHPTEPFATVGRDLTIEGEVGHFGRQDVAAQLVQLFVDGRLAGEARVDLPAAGSAPISFVYRFDHGDDHVAEVRIAGDLLDIDNHRFLSLPVREYLRVLCVNGKPAGQTLAGATDFLVLALSPTDPSTRRALVHPEVVTESALVDVDLTHYDCVFLCNVGQFTAPEAQLLGSYLKSGGGLVFFLGDQVRPDSYNLRLGGEEGPRVLPARLGELRAESAYHFDPLGYTHPIVSQFRGKERAGLLSTVVNRYFQLQLSDRTSAKVALAFEGGDPAIVEEPIHRGRSILVATSADDSWATMAKWPSYLPIVQEILALAVEGRLEDHNLMVGQPLGGMIRSVATDDAIGVRKEGAAESETGRAAPGDFAAGSSKDRRNVRVSADGDFSHWSYAETTESGVYLAEIGPPVSRTEKFAVNVDTAESDLTKLDPSELREEVWPGVDFTHCTDFQDLDVQPTTGIGRRGPLHRALLYTALGLLFGESFLAWWFGRPRR